MNHQKRTNSTRTKKPQWWQLYVMLPLLTGLYFPEMRLHITGTEHIIAQLAILFLIYGFIQMWISANRSALMRQDDWGEAQGQREWRVRTYQMPPTLKSQPDARPLLHLPEAGVKGMLSTTFEMDDCGPDGAIPVDPEVMERRDMQRLVPKE